MPVTVSDLPRIVRQLTPHISTDYNLPPLHGIYLEADGTHLFAAATDRFTFALTRREAAEPEPWKAFLAHADLTALRALFPTRRRPADLTLTHHRGCTRTPDGRLTIGDGTRSLNLSANAGHAKKFPKWRKLFADALAAEPHQDAEACYNADFLARWAKATDRWQPLTTWSAGPGKPLLVAAGPDFLGLHMPVSQPEHRPETPARQRQDRTALRTVWADTLTPAAPARRLKAA
ncbi:hypothetical protein AB0C76_08475 [Kitasatospora sp. NPDC048722]|uniref:hypothetical protein n=1 Tax=Kitasatospora sp. NPDC048722 TaxID=3155639 RepID=UPI0033E5B9A4